MDAGDLHVAYAGLIDTAHRRLVYLRGREADADATVREARLDRALTWLLRRAPADVLSDLVDVRPEYQDRVFEALTWAMELRSAQPPA